MQTTRPLLPHLAFYEALAVLDESNPTWNETVAGLLTIRLFDSWGAMARRGERVQAWEVAGVAEAVDALPATHPARAPLRAIVDAVRSRNASPAATLPQLADYARALRFDAKWLLAADVFSTMLSNAYGAPDDFVVGAAFHRGYCLRMAGDLEAAAASYDEGRALAASCGSEAGMLEADVSQAALVLHRGNLPAAEALLDSVIKRAKPTTCRHVLARALHERATVAARRGRHWEAIVFGYRALPLYEAAVERDRVLGDIAAALGAAGHHSAAWDAHQLLAATAQEQQIRWVAAINLIELAAWRDNERLFDRFRADLADVALPLWLASHYHLHVAEGHRRFGHQAEAEMALREAITTATAAGVNEVRMRAEDLMADLGRRSAPIGLAIGVPPESLPPESLPPDVSAVIAGVRAMRELAGVAAE